MLRKALFAAKKRPVKSAIVTPIAEFSKAIRHRRSVRRRAGYFMTSIWSPLSEIKRGIRGFQEKSQQSGRVCNTNLHVVCIAGIEGRMFRPLAIPLECPVSTGACVGRAFSRSSIALALLT